MVKTIDYQAAQPFRRFTPSRPTTIPRSPLRVSLATIRIRIPSGKTLNRVELVATVGVRGVTGVSQILFRIFRDGREIFNTQVGIESDSESEVNYVETFQAIDFNVGQGSHVYQVTAQNLTRGTEAEIVGPVSFSGLAIARS